MNDLIIIGTGPAGYTASIYASRYKIKHVLIGEISGGLATEAHKICNFPSEMNISGMDLMEKIQKSAISLGSEILADKVSTITKNDTTFKISTESGKTYESKTVLLASGTKHRKLNIENEKNFVGRGVSYCATCDALFYKNKTVAVIGGGNSAMTAALYLAEVAEKVYLIYRGSELKGETAWRDQVTTNNKINVIYNTNIIEFIGDTKLKATKIDNTYNNSDEITVDGVFIEIGSEPDLSIAKDLNIETENGHIKIKNDQSTNVNGIWAAGDITNGSNNFRQIITACSEGAIASDAIHKYLTLNK